MIRTNKVQRGLLIGFALLAVGAGGWYALRSRDAMAQARSLMQKGDIHGAQLVLRDLVRAHPELADAHLRLGQVYLQVNDPIAAEHELREATDRGADEHAVRPLLAQALVGQNHADVVLRDFKVDGLDAAKASDLHIARAIAAVMLKQPELARQEAAAARLASPQSPDAAVNAARVAQATGDLGDALHEVEQATAINPHFYPALLLRAQILARRGDTPAALAAYDTALADPSSKTLDVSGARLARADLNLAMRNDKAARSDVEAVLKARPRSPLGNYMLGLLDVRAGQWKQADEALAAVGPVLDQFPRGDILLATIKANVGAPQQALDAAERFNGHHPGDIGGAKLLATLELAQGKAAAASRLLAPWSTSGHADSDMLVLLSQAYARSGQPDQAQATLRQAGTISGGDAGMLSRIASVALGEGDAGLAADTLQTALDREPVQPAVQQGPETMRPQLADVSPTNMPANNAPARADTAAALVVTLLRAGRVDQAMAALDTLRAAHGDPGQVDLLTGAVKMAQFDLAGARAAFESARARNPDSAPAIVNLARVIQLQGDIDGASSLLQAALAKQPTDPTLLSAFVDTAIARKAPDEAVAMTEKAHAAAPTNDAITVGLASVYLRTGQPAKALALADTLPADSPSQLGLRADAQRALGHMDEALVSWRALLAKMPQDVALRRGIVGFLITDKRYDDAEAILRDGLAGHPDDAGLQADAIALATRKGGLDAGLARADGFAAQATDPRTRLLKGDLLLANRKFAEAATAFAQARNGLPKDAAPGEAEALLLRQANATIAAGDKSGGVKLMQDWFAAHPDSPAVLEALAENDLAAGYLKEARLKLETVLKSQPNNATALNNLAWIEQQQGDGSAALAHAARAYTLAPTPQSADTLGWAMLAGGRGSEALVLLRQAAASQPPDPAIQYHFAVALKQAGKPDDARAVLKPLIDTGSQFGERAQAEQLLKTLTQP